MKTLSFFRTFGVASAALIFSSGFAGAVVLVDPDINSAPSGVGAPAGTVESSEVDTGWVYDGFNDGPWHAPQTINGSGGTALPAGVTAWQTGGAFRWMANVVTDNAATTGQQIFEYSYTAVDTDGGGEFTWEIWGYSGTYTDNPFSILFNTTTSAGWTKIDGQTVDIGNLNSSWTNGDPFPTIVDGSANIDLGAGYTYIGVRISGNDVLDNNNEFFALDSADIVPVPEPSAAALLLGGLGMLFFRRRRSNA